MAVVQGRHRASLCRRAVSGRRSLEEISPVEDGGLSWTQTSRSVERPCCWPGSQSRPKPPFLILAAVWPRRMPVCNQIAVAIARRGELQPEYGSRVRSVTLLALAERAQYAGAPALHGVRHHVSQRRGPARPAADRAHGAVAEGLAEGPAERVQQSPAGERQSFLREGGGKRRGRRHGQARRQPLSLRGP